MFARFGRETLITACLLFGSGMCALIYQLSWMRLFRSFFGVSTQASGAVLAIFIGGLGLGALLMGRRIDRCSRPLHLYGMLELGICLGALLSMLLMVPARWSYLSLGGIESLGNLGAAIIRLPLATLVIGFPALLMGGTLGAATRAVTGASDSRRARTGLLYGCNTLGAFTGGLLASFTLHEKLGVHKTLMLAVLINLVIGLLALHLSRRPLFPEIKTTSPSSAVSVRSWVPFAAGVTGFVFLLQEMVWYRLLSPLLGGSTYTISLILCGALVGIGIGGALYPVMARRFRPSVALFSVTCSLEAVCLLLPFALADQITVWVAGMGGPGFGSLLLGWSMVIVLVIVPGSLVAGVQYPLLIALMGEGRAGIGRQIGSITLFNSLGSIAGSLSGGFGLMMVLGANSSWRLAAMLLSATALWALLYQFRRGTDRRLRLVSLSLIALSSLFALQPGPSASWRHAGLGVGRGGLPPNAGPNDIEDWHHVNQRQIFWERDGIESSIALSDLDGYAFLVNGKTDGNTLADAPTQVMSGLLGAALHPNPKHVLVIGLGTGSTAGWLAAMPGIERVDVVELEPVVEYVAELAAPVNHDALQNPKINLIYGDAREFLLTTSQRYDLIFSEPSNPYRAGIASLYTSEYYQAAIERLKSEGLFLQWLQGYSVDEITIRRVYSTLLHSFPFVETWIPGNRDFILIASLHKPVHNLDLLAQRLAQDPFQAGMNAAWRVRGLTGFLSRYYANPDFAKDMASFDMKALNRDDRPLIEFAMARSVGRNLFDPYQTLLSLPEEQRRPWFTGNAPNWLQMDEARINLVPEGMELHRSWWKKSEGDAELARKRCEALLLYYRLDRGAPEYPARLQRAHELWQFRPDDPLEHDGLLLEAEWAAYNGDPRTPALISRIRQYNGTEAEVISAMLGANQDPVAAGNHLLAAFEGHQKDPWPRRSLIDAALMLTPWVASKDAAMATRLFETLLQPFSVESLKYKRLVVLAHLSGEPGLKADCRQAFELTEPFVPWDADYLRLRAACYERSDDPKAEQAEADLKRFRLLSLKFR